MKTNVPAILFLFLVYNLQIQATTIFVNGTCGNDSWTGGNPNCIEMNGPKQTIQAEIDCGIMNVIFKS